MRNGAYTNKWRCAVLMALGSVSPALAQVTPIDSEAPTQHHDQPQAKHEAQMQHMMKQNTPPQSSSRPPDDGSSEAEHIAPEPPQHPMPELPRSVMARMMQMDDSAPFGQILLDQAEWRHSSEADSAAWEGQGWYGNDYNKLWVKSEGEREEGITEDARVDVLWDRIITRWWSLQAGAREDFGNGPPRTWAAVGLQGIAPYWFDVEATFYAGEQGRTAARLKAEYDLLITQRLILQPEAELNVYGKPDPARRIGSGLSDLDSGIRLRYEFTRQLAPYIGFAWTRRFGRTAALARAARQSVNENQVVAGVRWWF